MVVKETPAQVLLEEENVSVNDLVKNSYDLIKSLSLIEISIILFQNCKSKNVLRKIEGATPAEGKMFHGESPVERHPIKARRGRRKS